MNMTPDELVSFLNNRSGHVPFDTVYWVFIILNFVSYFILSMREPTTFRGAIRRIKAAAYAVLMVWTTYKIVKDDFDLPITIPALIGWSGVMFSDFLYSIFLHTRKEKNVY